MGKFLDQSGLEYYDGKIKAVIKKKQDTLVAGANIKTINNQSILGSGNLTVGGATAGVTSIGGKTGAITLSGLVMMSNNVLLNPATGSLAKKNSATGDSPAVTFAVISGVSNEANNWGWKEVKASGTISFIESIDNYDYLYIEGVNDNPLSGSTTNADCSHIFIPVGIWKIYTSTAHTLSLSNYSSRARIYYKSSTSMGVDKTSSLNWLRVFGVKRGTITVS